MAGGRECLGSSGRFIYPRSVTCLFLRLILIPPCRMLRALELAGFKSFADRTRFEFPDGITVVVGPNGSGKSNIVDAIKWVLGSQSAKSLRGKEMSDVIFKGSDSRPGAGAAEATIIFDNSSGDLPLEATEVHVTRRVYRSGEGEYLINNQAVRLKDVKNLIRGTGIGIDAYSLIEQGKVDRMLQANAKDRRAIFEEAAGISRFKAKKVEAERRLARVQQNLTRLGDIVDEVASRLRSLKSQASKAERYRQATERLRELRTQVAWADWTTLSDELQTGERELAEAISRHRELDARRQQIADQRQSLELELQEIADRARGVEEQRGQSLRQIAELNGRRVADEASIGDLRSQVAAALRRVRLLQTRAGSAAAELRSANERLREYQRELDTVRERLSGAEQERDEIQAEVAEVQVRRDDLRQQHLAAVRRVADLESKRQRGEQQIAETTRRLDQLQKRAEQSRELLHQSTEETERAAHRLASLDESIHEFAKRIELATAALQQSRRTLQRRRDEGSALKVRLQGVTERLSVLEDLQRRQEGVSGGVRTILEQWSGLETTSSAQQKSRGTGESGPVGDSGQSLQGIVADCFEVDVEVAPLVDAALGDRSQYLVCEGDAIQRAILENRIEINSRVGILRIDELPRRRAGDRIRLDGLRGVIGRLDRMIRCDDRHAPLARHLLGSTWLVDSLKTAWGLRKLSGAGLRFVTASGELLESDGTTVLGPGGVATGLVSRRSEMASAEQEIKHYRYQLTESEQESQRLSVRVDQEAAELGQLEQKHRALITDRAGVEAEHRHLSERLESRRVACDELAAEMAATVRERDETDAECRRIVADLTEQRRQVETLELHNVEVEEMFSGAQTALQQSAAAVMSVSVDVARAEQKVEALSVTLEQQRRDQSQREAAVAEVRQQAAQGRTRLGDLTQRILDATSRLALLHWESERDEAQLRELARAADAIREQMRRHRKSNESVIQEANQANEAVHAITSKRDNAKLRRDTLAERMLEDYEIDLRGGERPEDWVPPEDRDAVDAEITSLRGQVQKTGSVNMEALEELEELQTRYDELHGQYQDLTAAKDSLQRIISRINADSRRLFLDTLEAIRQNFQKLYRKSFGGGTADLILEESDDPLEAGVEIVATPPGKPSFNNSLLSGGEKALTAVALLMAIFQYRPSPFCVLDEVDAPFDEANIGRFVTVLTEFLDQTKFVVVTHSKKTMTAANTLYGVTMQESGVSKQVSIRFEDVSEDGEINAGGEAA
jgi:chromosome segregation protein